MYRAALALNSGDPVAAIAHAERTLTLAGADDLPRAAASALSGLASWAMGDLEAALSGYTLATEGLRRVGRIADVCGTSITLADLEMTLGRLDSAQRALERALELAAREGPGLRGTADMLVGLSRVAWERNDLTAAADQLRRADQLGEAAGLAQNPYRWRVAMARLREAEGDVASALQLLEEAQRVYVGDYSPNVQPVPAVRARMLAAHGRVDEALDWVRREGLSLDDELSYLREYEHVTLARILLAQRSAEAPLLLDRLLTAAEAGGRVRSVLEILALQALQHDDLAPLERAVALAEPGGWVRVLAGEGPPMQKLLGRLARDRPDQPFLRRVVEAAQTGAGPAPAAQAPTAQPLVDPLSDRELDVLRLLASDLDGPEIARHLVVSLNTVRTHTKHIYAKLGVNNRRSAVSRAHQLGVLSR
jgi:LuxR family maltose regulon positive regulatory protein